MTYSDHTNASHLPRTSLPLDVIQAVLDSVDDTMALVGPDGEILAVNHPWQEFMSQNHGEQLSCGVGANYLQVCEGASGPNAAEGLPVGRALASVLNGSVPHFEMEYPCHGPALDRWFVVRIRPLQHGTERYALVTHLDVTARWLTAQRRSDLDVEVAHEVQLRTRNLQAENDELDSFVGAVSHDLRTPLRHLQGFLGLLRQRLEPRGLAEEDLRLLDVLSASSLRLNRMLDELLALARVSRQALSFHQVNLSEVIRDAWGNLTPELQDREVDWQCGELPRVYGEPELLRLAFENLLNNALKYTAGQPVACIQVSCELGISEAVIAVHDNGVGFDPRYASRLFGAFQRLHSDREFSGVGMGLANVKRIVQRHGGRVWAEAQPGRGATFFLALPLQPPPGPG
ncbi:sensor histidine kinase [Deinococcus sonorensis]|uniref:histidine kinase n=2 Tax=Deinococcus sonorensis TaxID=309891 RepID=A0AAU7UGS7_9DEIO